MAPACSTPPRPIDYYVTDRGVQDLVQDAWTDFTANYDNADLLDATDSRVESLRVTLVNWDNHITGLEIASLDTELRRAVSRTPGVRYFDRAYMQEQLQEARLSGVEVDPGRPEQIFVARVRDAYARALGIDDQNIYFAVRGTLTNSRNVFKLELSVLDVGRGEAWVGIGRREIEDLPEVHY